jgi:hydroxymethylglutaryl-CoA lyase
MADAEAVMARVPRVEGVSYLGLVLNRRGAERAIDAGVDELNAVVVATDEFSRRNQGTTVAEGARVWAEIAALAERHGIPASVTVAVAFGCPFEGEVAPERVFGLVRQLVEHGPAEIALADTIGVGVPSQVTTLLDGVRELAPGVPLRCHFHNTRNTGYANAVAAVQAGVATLDASLGGIGGCPFAPAATGNIATEDLVYLLDRMGVETGLAAGRAAAAGTWICERLGIATPALLGRAGPFPVGHPG